jgi:hypothetical protein
VHVYDLVDWVTEAGLTAGAGAARFATSLRNRQVRRIPLRAGENVRYVVPHELNKDSLVEGDVRLQLRVTKPIEAPVWIEVRAGGHLIQRKAEPYARPGEMVTIRLMPKHFDSIDKATDLAITVVPR